MNRRRIETILIILLIIISLIYFVIDFSLLTVIVLIISCVLLKFSYPIENKPIKEEPKKEKKIIVEKKEEETCEDIPLINFPDNFDEKEFLKNAFLLYQNIQTNLMNFEYDELMQELGIDIYEQFLKQMKSLENRNKQSVRVNIKLDKIQTISFLQEKDYSKSVIYLGVLEDKYTKGIEEEFRLTSARVRYESCYNITLVKRNKKRILRKCSFCHEKIIGNPYKCPMCNTMLLENCDNWIMTDLKLVCSHSKKES